MTQSFPTLLSSEHKRALIRMTIWTDAVHLVSERDDEELNDCAREIGFRRTWFQGHRFPNHYDITTSAAARRAVLAGARCVAGMKDLLRILPGDRKSVV